MIYPIDKFGNEIERGDICAMDNGGSITILLYSHRANSTYVFLRKVDGKEIEHDKYGLYEGNKRYIQHTSTETQVINLDKLDTENLIKTKER
jgi:hypothetical protein